MADWSELEHLPDDVLTQSNPRAVLAVSRELAEPLAAAG
jgi:hypothetical protein